MTAITATAGTPGTAPSGFARILRVVRLNLANPWTTVIMPWIVLGAIFVLSYGIWILVFLSVEPGGEAEAREGMQWSGASMWIFVYLLVVAVQTMNLTFPLALGYGSTRRDFYLGSAATFVVLSVMWALGLTILSAIESATDGWGIGGRMFTTIFFGGDSPVWQRFVICLCISLFFFFVGAAVASVYVRWRVLGMIVFFFLLGLALIGALALIFAVDGWPAVGDFFVTNQAFGVSLWMLVPTAVAGLAGYLMIRGATPR
ncbi:MAG: ABC transporter permease [Schumannella sp.]